MHHRKLLSLLLLFLLTTARAQAAGHYTRTADGIVVYPNELLSGRLNVVKLSVISDRIIRVVSCPAADPVPQTESLIVLYKRDSLLRWGAGALSPLSLKGSPAIRSGRPLLPLADRLLS